VVDVVMTMILLKEVRLVTMVIIAQMEISAVALIFPISKKSLVEKNFFLNTSIYKINHSSHG